MISMTWENRWMPEGGTPDEIIRFVERKRKYWILAGKALVRWQEFQREKDKDSFYRIYLKYLLHSRPGSTDWTTACEYLAEKRYLCLDDLNKTDRYYRAMKRWRKRVILAEKRPPPHWL